MMRRALFAAVCLLALAPGAARAQGTFPGLLGPGQVLGNDGTGTGLPAPVNPTPSGTSCPSWLTAGALFLNSANASAEALQVFDGSRCVTIGTLNTASHAFGAGADPAMATVGGAL
jgi:hypothetical protein